MSPPARPATAGLSDRARRKGIGPRLEEYVPTQDRLQRVRAVYEAFAAGDRAAIEDAFTGGFLFSSPLDVGLDRAGYFERCWPGSGQRQTFEFVRLIESGEEVVVTYEMTGADGTKGRNTEIFTFDGDRISQVEVYFGWTVPDD